MNLSQLQVAKLGHPRPGRPGPGAQWPKSPVSLGSLSESPCQVTVLRQQARRGRRGGGSRPCHWPALAVIPPGCAPPGPARGARSSPRLGAQGAASVDGQGEQHASIGFLVLRAFKLRPAYRSARVTRPKSEATCESHKAAWDTSEVSTGLNRATLEVAPISWAGHWQPESGRVTVEEF